jgi:hypothetical protein
MADIKYTDSTPVDEPVAPQPKKKISLPKQTKQSKPVLYPDSVPVDEPVAKAKGGMVSSASSRADGIAQRGKTKGRMC